jgi:hypothetical protein
VIHPQDRRIAAGVIVATLVGLSYVAALDAWPRFLEGFGDNLCEISGSRSPRHTRLVETCVDGRFRTYAIPIGAAALAVSAFAAAHAGPPGRIPRPPFIAVGILAIEFVLFAAWPTTRSCHFVAGGMSAAIASGAIWRSRGSSWFATLLVAFLTPWPFLAFAYGYPAPG